MSVDVGDLVDSLKREVNPPGISLLPDAVDAEYEGHLSDAFWELVQFGYISGFTEADGIITEDIATPVDDLTKEYQQLIVISAGLRIMRLLILNLDTLFRSKAGPVEFEVQKSANALNNVLDHLQSRFNSIVARLPNSKDVSTLYYSDTYTLMTNTANEWSQFIGS
jgi:hypothetical protein